MKNNINIEIHDIKKIVNSKDDYKKIGVKDDIIFMILIQQTISLYDHKPYNINF